MMRRPDQDKFDQFAGSLEKFDPHWVAFERTRGFVLERNPNRNPGRILRKDARTATCWTKYHIELYLEPIWYQSEFGDDLPYTFVAGAYFELFSETDVFWKASTVLVAGQTIERIGHRLPGLLAEGIGALETFTPEYMMKFGEKHNRFNLD